MAVEIEIEIEIDITLTAQEIDHIMVKIQGTVEAVVELHGVGNLHSIAVVVEVVIPGRHQKGNVFVNFMKVGGARRGLRAAICTHKTGNFGR